MAAVPGDEDLKKEVARRSAELEAAGSMNAKPAARERILLDLIEIQKSIDNRGDAILKVGAFLGTGLAVLAKFDSASAVSVLSIVVIIFSGLALGGALMAQDPPTRRAHLLTPVTQPEVEQSCRALTRNQAWLAAGTFALVPAVLCSVIAVVVSVA
jgi:hypothetical protein